MVITIETVLKERGLRYVSKSLCNARMDWFTFLTEITLSEWSDRVIFKPADASPRKYTQLLKGLNPSSVFRAIIFSSERGLIKLR